MMENQPPAGVEPYLPALPYAPQLEALGLAVPNQINYPQHVTRQHAMQYSKLADLVGLRVGAFHFPAC